ncbi:hypothetical protein R3P38DRAFT_2802195 [Favolaschia claudopus]|uniref:Uncharacterized protein n=1 Tax=Favolaschia claudopus TaxID=2862362 RepID=A0AAV9ZV02_9AGAR
MRTHNKIYEMKQQLPPSSTPEQHRQLLERRKYGQYCTPCTPASRRVLTYALLSQFASGARRAHLFPPDSANANATPRTPVAGHMSDTDVLPWYVPLSRCTADSTHTRGDRAVSYAQQLLIRTIPSNVAVFSAEKKGMDMATKRYDINFTFNRITQISGRRMLERLNLRIRPTYRIVRQPCRSAWSAPHCSTDPLLFFLIVLVGYFCGNDFTIVSVGCPSTSSVQSAFGIVGVSVFCFAFRFGPLARSLVSVCQLQITQTAKFNKSKRRKDPDTPSAQRSQHRFQTIHANLSHFRFPAELPDVLLSKRSGSQQTFKMLNLSGHSILSDWAHETRHLSHNLPSRHWSQDWLKGYRRSPSFNSASVVTVLTSALRLQFSSANKLSLQFSFDSHLLGRFAAYSSKFLGGLKAKALLFHTKLRAGRSRKLDNRHGRFHDTAAVMGRCNCWLNLVEHAAAQTVAWFEFIDVKDNKKERGQLVQQHGLHCCIRAAARQICNQTLAGVENPANHCALVPPESSLPSLFGTLCTGALRVYGSVPTLASPPA